MIKNLYESVKTITEESLPDMLQKASGISEEQAVEIVKELSFTEYLDLAKAVKNEDEAKIQTFLGEAILPDTEEEEVSKVTPNEIVTKNKATGAETTTPTGDDMATRFTQPDASKKASVTDTGELASASVDDLEVGDDIFTSQMDEEIERIRELAGLQETSSSPSFTSSVVLDDGRIVDDVTVEYYYEPEEPAEQGYPGAPAEAHIEAISYNGKEIELDDIANLDDLKDEALEAADQAGQDEYDQRGDYEMERQRERRYNETLEVDETASCGGTGAGGIATAVTATSGKPGIKRKPTDEAVTEPVGGKRPNSISHTKPEVGSKAYTSGGFRK